MKIVEIRSASFGPLNIQSPVQFRDGFNLWVAPNQAGKTSLLTFIEWMLYGPPPRRGARDTQALRRWMPWNGSQMEGRIVVRPELKDWPGELLVTAKFTDATVALSEHNTQKILSERVVVSKLGEWNLGEQLLNMDRDSFRHSIFATQENLLDPLQPGALRRILTSDLGALVENPDLATVDRILAIIEDPVFKLDGSEPKPLKLLRHDTVKEQDFLQLERTKLEKQLAEFRDLLEQRDSTVAQLEQQERATAALQRQVRQLELARAYYLLKTMRSARPAQAASDEGGDPGVLKQITPELEREVDNLAGQLQAIERQLALESGELAQLEERQRRLEETLRSTGRRERVEPAYKLREVAATVEASQAEHRRAAALSQQLEARIPEKDRARYADLDNFYEPHKDHLTAIMEWQKEHLAINERLVQLRERRAELQVRSRAPFHWTFWLGWVLLVPSVWLLMAISRVVGTVYFNFGIMGIVVLTFISGALITAAWRRRSITGPVATELRTVVVPAIEAEQNQLGVQDRKRRRYIELYGIDRNTWDKLVENIVEYSQLDMQMREFTSAVRDRDMVNRRLNTAWLEVAALLPLAPVNIDMNWLREQLQNEAAPPSAAETIEELHARINEQRADVNRLQADRDRCLELLNSKLGPLGLGARPEDGWSGALRDFRRLADQARLVVRPVSDSVGFEDAAIPLSMSEEEFERAWSELSETERGRIAGMTGSRQGFETVCSRLREALTSREEVERQRERLRSALEVLRDELTKFGRIDRDAEELNEKMTRAHEKQGLIDRWDKALRVSGSILSTLVNHASQNAAPEVDRALRQVLSDAQLPGVSSVGIGGNLELQLRVEGANPEVPPAELWTYLSSGAQQQLALALRLAMARTASGRTDLPLLLDEPLADLDDKQASLVFKYVAQMSKATQVIVTTCHEKQFSWLADKAEHMYAVKVE